MSKKVVNIDKNMLREMVARSLRKTLNEWSGDIDYNPDPKESMSMLRSVLKKKLENIVGYLQEANACYQRRDVKGMSKWGGMALHEAEIGIEDIDNNWNDGESENDDWGENSFAYAGAVNEMGDTEDMQYKMGRLYKRKKDNNDMNATNDVADHAIFSMEDKYPDRNGTGYRKLLNAFHDGINGIEQGSHSKFMNLK